MLEEKIITCKTISCWNERLKAIYLEAIKKINIFLLRHYYWLQRASSAKKYYNKFIKEVIRHIMYYLNNVTTFIILKQRGNVMKK